MTKASTNQASRGVCMAGLAANTWLAVCLGPSKGETLELEIFNTMRTSLTLGLWMLLEIIVTLITLFVIVGFAIYLGGLVWLCREEMRLPPQQCKKTPPKPLTSQVTPDHDVVCGELIP
jgi:hypothetical protein